MADPTRVVAYYRMSTMQQTQSIPQQQAWAQEVCAKEGITLVAEFQDEGISGNKTSKRDGFKQMLAYCQKHRNIEAVVCWEASRFSRADVHETGYYIWQFREAGLTRMLTHEGWTDWEQGTQRLIQGITQELANHEPLIIHSSRVIRGQVANVKNGNQNGGSSAYGMCKVLVNERGEHVRIIKRNEKVEKPRGWKTVRVPAKGTKELETVRWIFESFADTDTSYRGIATDLNARKVPSPAGAVWEVNSVRNILTNPIYKGDYEWGRVSSGDYHRLLNGEIQVSRRGTGRRPNQEAFVLPGAVEPIVSPDLWERCQQKIRGRRQERRKPRSMGNVLTGLLYCGACGGRMSGDGTNPRRYTDRDGNVREYTYVRYTCRTAVVKGRSACPGYSIREAKLLPTLVRKLQELYLGDDRIESLRGELLRQIEEQRGTEPDRLEHLRDRLRQIEADVKQGRDNLLRVRDSAVFAELNNALGELVQERAAMQAEIGQLETASGRDEGMEKQLVEKAIDKLRQLGQELANAEPQRLREVFLQMLVRVDLYYEEQAAGETRKRRRFLKGVATLRPQNAFSGKCAGCSSAFKSSICCLRASILVR